MNFMIYFFTMIEIIQYKYKCDIFLFCALIFTKSNKVRIINFFCFIEFFNDWIFRKGLLRCRRMYRLINYPL